MLLLPPNSHPHSPSHSGSSCMEQVNHTNSHGRDSCISPCYTGPPSPPITIKQQPLSPQSPSNTSSSDHMSALSDANYLPVSSATTASSQHLGVSGRSQQASPAPLSAPGTPAPTTAMPVPVTTRPSSGGSASGGPAPLVTNNSISSAGIAAGVGTSRLGLSRSSSIGTSIGTLPSATPADARSPGQLPQHHPLLGYIPDGSNKILSRNNNGTLTVTCNPSNESELQLYRVLQRANLLNYYDTFISQGGDDVQQLCEAGEEEFLEIMALVGMASKPLHVRRLQKALQEWVSNPGLFLMPLKSPAPAPTSGMPPQMDAFKILSSLTTSNHQLQQPQSSNITHSSHSGRIPHVAGTVAAAAPHTVQYQRPQPYPSPENLTSRKTPPNGSVSPQPGSVSPTDYRRVLEAAWALRAAGQQDLRRSPPGGGKITPPGGMNNRSTWPSTMSPPSSNRSPGNHTDTLHNSSESQPFLPGTPVPWFPFLGPVNKL